MIKNIINNYLKINTKVWIIGIIILIILILLIFSICWNKANAYIEEDINDIVLVKEPLEDSKNKDNKKEKEMIYYYVDIKGAVINPNVYKLEKESRVVDVIKMAGGLTKDADTSLLNLSKKIIDEMTIIIYTEREVRNFKEEINEVSIDETLDYIESSCQCPDPEVNQACICDEENISNEKISINTATATILQTLPGIGESKATDIIEYRNENGPFTKLEDLKKVSGIGESVFDKIKDYITL
jgi:competence protein ComEA